MTLLKNLRNKEYKAPVVYSTNKPWKIDDKEFFETIHCSIEISVSSYEKRKELIKMILKECEEESIDVSMIDPNDVAQRTINYLNSDLYVLLRQMMMEPYREMVENGMVIENIRN